MIDVASLPVVSSTGQPPVRSPARPEASDQANSVAPESASAAGRGEQDVFVTLERLADLRTKGILSNEEFSANKTELLSRI